MTIDARRLIGRRVRCIDGVVGTVDRAWKMAAVWRLHVIGVDSEGTAVQGDYGPEELALELVSDAGGGGGL